MTVALAITITAGIVAVKLISAIHDYAVTRAIVKYTGKAPYGWEGVEDEED